MTANAMLKRTLYRVTVLSPVHVGAGQELTAHDVALFEGQLWRFDVDRVVERLAGDRRLTDRYATEGAAALSAWPPEVRRACARYVHPWGPGEAPPRVRAHIADLLGRPYVPGSSLKGALRTALLRQAIERADEHVRAGYRKTVPSGGKPQGAGQSLERAVLGRDPNHDVLRALRVEDGSPVPVNRLRVAEIKVAVREPNGSLTWFVRPRQHVDEPDKATSIWAEAIIPRTTFTVGITLDEYLVRGSTLTGEAAPGNPPEELGFRARRHVLARWALACRRDAYQVAKGEYEWAKACGFKKLANFYAWLSREINRCPAGAFLLCVGWGTGWRAKSVAEALGKELVAQIRRSFRLGKGPIFPKTRRIVFEQGEPALPLGWLRLEPVDPSEEPGASPEKTHAERT